MADFRQVIGPTIMLFFIALVLIIAIIALYKYFSNRLAMRMVRDMLNENKELTAAQITALFNNKHKDSDVRNGFIGLGLALASIIFGVILGANDFKLAQTSFIGMAVFPGVLGLTYLYFHNKNK